MLPIDQIKALPISEVIGQYINLKKTGNTFKACCPFHNEKTPSFNVNNARNIYKCFGCGHGGDAITFVQEFNKTDFTGAIKDICERFKIEFKPNGNDHDKTDIQRRNKDSLFILNKIAAAWFTDQLQAHKPAHKYLNGDRALTTETIKNRQLGFAPDSWTALYEYLKSQQYTDEQLQYSGLITYKDDGKTYDYFRNRIIIPIIGLNGKIIGFGGRILTGEDPKAPKYINSPETAIYSKGTELYNFNEARAHIQAADLVYITEGYFDVLTTVQNGINNIVAGSGTALTDDQIQLISRYTKNVVMLYDADKAGQNAANKNGENLLNAGLNVSIINLINKDIDVYIKEN